MTGYDADDWRHLERAPRQTAAETLAATMQHLQNERDRAVGAVLVLAHDGVISQSRAAELLGMTMMQVRTEVNRRAALPTDAGQQMGEGRP